MPDPEDVTGPSAATPSQSDEYLTDWGTAAPVTRSDLPANPARYALGEEIARGGMGAVYRATDTAFGRDVAVKVLREVFASNSGAYRRFDDEARITGQLQHPNIPAVFERGALADGRPFLAMKLIRGETLADLLAHRPDPSHERGRFVAVFEQVCQAVAYAHAHGVIHRDLKPGNVMVGAFGEVQVMDWGLAKVLTSRDREEADVAPRQGADAASHQGANADPNATTAQFPIQMSHDDGDLFTQAGSVLGTPAFMPPEQAIGAVDQIDRRSDVFGLGGILTAILTGTPPFLGGGEAARQQAAKGKVQGCFERLDGCGADPELVALCKRCLSPEKAARPADADEVAKAVARLRIEADERARRAELERVEAESRGKERRKRRRVWIVAAAALAVAVVGGLTAVLVVQRRANAELASKNEEVDEERARAEQRFELAAKAIETFHTGVTEDSLLKNEQLKGLRDKLLGEAAGFYRELEGLLKNLQDEASRRALGEAYFKLACLTAIIGDKKQALEVHQRSLTIRQKLAEAHPSVADYQNALASSHNNLGSLLSATGQGEEAVKAYRLALGIRQQLVEAHPAVPEYQSALANSHNNLGLLLSTRGQKAEAVKAYRQALGLHQQLAEAHPSVPLYQSDLAGSHNNLGVLLRETGQREEAVKEYRQALGLQHKLAEAHPSVLLYQSDLAGSHNNLGILLSAMGQKAEALKAFQHALGLRRQLAEAHPAVTKYKSDLASSHNSLGILLSETGQPAEAVKAFRQALGLQQKLAEAHPDVLQYQSGLARGLNNLGVLLSETGQPAEAVKAFRQAIGLRQRLAEAHPDVPQYQIELARSCCTLGNLQRDAGEPLQSLLLYLQAMDRLQAVLKTQPRHPTARQYLRDSHWGRALSLGQLKRHREALTDWEQALTLDNRTARATLQLRLASCLARCGESGRAVEQAAKLLAEPSVNYATHYDAANVYALSAHAATTEAGRPLAERLKRADGYACQAVALLRQAQQGDYFADPRTVAQMQKDDALNFLRPRQDFQALLGELGATPERLPMPRRE